MFGKRNYSPELDAPRTAFFREPYRVYCVALDIPITFEDLQPYGLKVVTCMPLSMDDQWCHYLAVVSAPSRIVYCTDSMYGLLNDFYKLRGDGYGHVLRVTCVHEFYSSPEVAK